MTDKSLKNVLIVDDEVTWHEVLKKRFGDYEKKADCPYRFRVDTASSAAEGIQMFRQKTRQNSQYEVIVLDIRMETPEAGLDACFGVGMQLRDDLPVIIFLTGYGSNESCVRAIRNGAWDYTTKEDVGDRFAAQVVVDSAADRLQELDLRRSYADVVASWLPEHLGRLQTEYGGHIVALWREDDGLRVVASGVDAFDLARAL